MNRYHESMEHCAPPPELEEQLLAQDPALTSCPATAERVTELFTQQADALN